jgi:hypothetical protein
MRIVTRPGRGWFRSGLRLSYVEGMNDPFLPTRAILFATVVLALCPSVTVGQVSHCTEAARFLGTERGMAIVTESDTIDDWRTDKRQPGCRVTSAGLTQNSLAEEAVRFYEHVRRDGWTRTPDPRDSPGESSLRFRKRERDCLFNVYGSALLGTDAERKVETATSPRPGESRYYVFVQCMPAQPAKPRGRTGTINRA